VTGRVSLSQSSPRIDEVWSWYSTSAQALAAYKQTIKASIVDKRVVCPDFVGFSLNDVDQHFGRQQEELELMVALALLIAAEGELRRDYWTRVYERRKDELSRHFREIHKHRGKRVLLEQHILAGWRRYRPEARSSVNEFIAALRYRHWLAHGRYWVASFGRRYDPEDVWLIVKDLLCKTQLMMP
jgi:hypothetical protein